MVPPRLTRRAVVRGAAGAALGAAVAVPGDAAAHDHDGGAQAWRRRPVPPAPIPGGIELGPGQVIHVWAPGPPDVTLPFTATTLQGLDTEPTTIRDFQGFAAVAFHVGTATGGDGASYDVETDMRAFQGAYVDGTGTRRFGTFGFVWLDLFVPGSGTPAAQVHDFNGGILSSGLFWTVPSHGREFRVSRGGRRAVLDMRDVPVIDSFQFFGPNQVAGTVSFRIEWRAGGDFVPRGSGAAVPPTDPAAFRGEIASASSTITASGQEWGFAFSAHASTDRGHAQLGQSRNGVFL